MRNNTAGRYIQHIQPHPERVVEKPVMCPFGKLLKKTHKVTIPARKGRAIRHQV